MLLLAGILSVFLNFLAIGILVSIIISLVKGAPPVPSNKKVINTILEIALEKKVQKAVDLGAGDGRIVKMLASQNIESHGYEINPMLVWWGRWRLKKAGLQEKGFLYSANLWKQNLESFDFVIIYGLPNVMHHFEEKLDKELQPGARVVSNSFKLPTWEPIKKVGNVYLYQKTEK